MSGTREGGLKFKQKILAQYGKNYYKDIGLKAERTGTGGFADRKKGKDGLTGSERSLKIWKQRKEKKNG